MPRLSYFGALLGIAALLSAPIFAQKAAPNSPQNSAPNRARVQHVVVRGTGAAMEVEIQTSGAPVAPDTQAITGPDRIVVDFPGALPAAELRALKVNRGALKGIRAGLFFSNPPITRVVLDLGAPVVSDFNDSECDRSEAGSGDSRWSQGSRCAGCTRRQTSECLAGHGYAGRGHERCGPESLFRSCKYDGTAASRRRQCSSAATKAARERDL